jgi:hypothetical protein
MPTAALRPITSGSNNTGFRKARVRAGLPKLRWHDLRPTWATWHAQAGTPAIVLQTLEAGRTRAWFAPTRTWLQWNCWTTRMRSGFRALRYPRVQIRPQWQRRTTGKINK